MHGEPGQHAEVEAIARALKTQQRHGLVDVGGVARAFVGRVGEVRIRTAADVRVVELGGGEAEMA